ncbi:MAG: hypothetical protein R3A44_31625 [Caldilineaceae bacterium]
MLQERTINPTEYTNQPEYSNQPPQHYGEAVPPFYPTNETRYDFAPYRSERSSAPQPDTGKDLLMGLVGGIAGVIAMDLFSQQIMPLLTQNGDQSSDHQNGQSQDNQQEQPLDSIALIGEHHRKNESATAALGRIFYHWATDEDPDKKTKTALSYLVHWGYGIAQGSAYAAMRGPAAGADLLGGAAFGTGLWLLGDEMVVPMLGLQDGPTAAGVETHMNRLAMHLVYGITTAATVQWLRRNL